VGYNKPVAGSSFFDEDWLGITEAKQCLEATPDKHGEKDAQPGAVAAEDAGAKGLTPKKYAWFQKPTETHSSRSESTDFDDGFAGLAASRTKEKGQKNEYHTGDYADLLGRAASGTRNVFEFFFELAKLLLQIFSGDFSHASSSIHSGVLVIA
jgi:hypothetical protein